LVAAFTLLAPAAVIHLPALAVGLGLLAWDMRAAQTVQTKSKASG